MPHVIELSISKCPGVIDDAMSPCNRTWSSVTTQSQRWFRRPFRVPGEPGAIYDAASATARQYCWAPEAEGTYYVNMRWSYAQCPYGVAQCGFNWQWNAAY